MTTRLWTLADYLDEWAQWMGGDDGPDEHRSTAAGFDNFRTAYHVRNDDPDIQADKRQASYGPIIDACIESLYDHERIAIHYVFGFSRVHFHPRNDCREVMLACLPRLAWHVLARLPLAEQSVAAMRQDVLTRLETSC